MKYIKDIEKYWNLRAEGFSKGILDEMKTDYDIWQNRFKKLLEEIPGKKILDIGCGPGFFTLILLKNGYEVTSMDYSEEMLVEAEKNVKTAGLKGVFVQGDAQNIPFKDEEFDAVVSRNLMWNLEEPEKAYFQWLRVLKKGGIIINCDGNHYSYFYNEEYQAERELPEYSDGHNKQYIKNINVNIIDEIAKNLPLSREKRPQWDMDTLLNMGVEYVSAEVERHIFRDKNNIEHNIIKKFVIKTVK